MGCRIQFQHQHSNFPSLPPSLHSIPSRHRLGFAGFSILPAKSWKGHRHNWHGFLGIQFLETIKKYDLDPNTYKDQNLHFWSFFCFLPWLGGIQLKMDYSLKLFIFSMPLLYGQHLIRNNVTFHRQPQPLLVRAFAPAVPGQPAGSFLPLSPSP
jgi:hypothetical protein